MTKQMAIIQDIRLGVYDRSKAMLYFTANIGGTCALQCLSVEDGVKMIEAYQSSDISDLNGKPCWCEVSNSMIKYIEPCIL